MYNIRGASFSRILVLPVATFAKLISKTNILKVFTKNFSRFKISVQIFVYEDVKMGKKMR